MALACLILIGCGSVETGADAGDVVAISVDTSTALDVVVAPDVPAADAATPPDVFVCPGTRVLCGATCADLASDLNDCGACGNICPPGASCVRAECVVPDAGSDALTDSGCPGAGPGVYWDPLYHSCMLCGIGPGISGTAECCATGAACALPNTACGANGRCTCAPGYGLCPTGGGCCAS